MNQSNELLVAVNPDSRSPIELVPSQKYKTSKGNEYIVNYIARESGNIEDLFAVYEEISKDQQDANKQSWVKKTTDFKSVDDFDEDQSLTNAQLEELRQQEGEDEISLDQKYQHFKTKDFYLIKAISRNRKNPKEKFIVYEGQYNSPDFGDHPIWIREYSDFTGMKTFDDERLPVKRFTLTN